MDLRLIAFDLDGTLLRSDKSISPRTMHALHAAQERGVLLVPATGRLYRSLPEALLDEQLSRYFILVNGAQVYDAQEDKTLLTEELPPELALPMLQFLKTRNVVRGVYIDGLGHMSLSDYEEIDDVAATPATSALMCRPDARLPLPAQQFLFRGICAVRQRDGIEICLNGRLFAQKILRAVSCRRAQICLQLSRGDCLRAAKDAVKDVGSQLLRVLRAAARAQNGADNRRDIAVIAPDEPGKCRRVLCAQALQRVFFGQL